MELVLLDEKLRPKTSIEGYISLIWTERYQEHGDFELEVTDTNPAARLLTRGDLLSLGYSARVMVISTVERKMADDGSVNIKFTGVSLEHLLNDRPAARNWTNADSLVWSFTVRFPQDIMLEVFNTVCRTPSLDPADKFPYLGAGTISPNGTLPLPAEPLSITLEAGSVYSHLETLAKRFNLGFRIVRKDNVASEASLHFEIFVGDDRTSNQPDRNAVIFAPNLENLLNTTQLTSDAGAKNIAYVFAKNGAGIVYDAGVSPTVSGIDRKVLLVSATDITSTGTTMDLEIQRRGLAELTKYRTIHAFDGEIPQNGAYVYGVDYNLGDLVELRDETGYASEMLVTEQIFVEDGEGERAYPTLALSATINPGSWLAWGGGLAWNEIDPSILWLNA